MQWNVCTQYRIFFTKLYFFFIQKVHDVFVISKCVGYTGCTFVKTRPLVSALERKYHEKSNLIPTPHPTANKVLSAISGKTGINYPDLEPGNKFWNRVRVPGSCYKSLATYTIMKISVNRKIFPRGFTKFQ